MKLGNKVRCRLYNSVECKFYGDAWLAEILEIDFNNKVGNHYRPYRVKNVHGLDMWLSDKEVRYEIYSNNNRCGRFFQS